MSHIRVSKYLVNSTVYILINEQSLEDMIKLIIVVQGSYPFKTFSLPHFFFSLYINIVKSVG